MCAARVFSSVIFYSKKELKMTIIGKTIYITALVLSCFLFQANSDALGNLITTAPQDKFTKVQIKQTTEQVIEVLRTEYVYPEKTESLVLKLRQVTRNPPNRYIDNKPLFLKEIGEVLRRMGGDGYIELQPKIQELTIGGELAFQYQQKKSNYAFEEARVLDGNIGYLKINHFFQNEEAVSVAENTFKLFKGTKALIIDVREASDGSIEFAQYLMSYFLNDKTLLSEMSYQRQEKRFKMWSVEGVGYSEFKQDYPIYILTSAFVTGAVEFFSYTMKHLDKAVVVGRKTMGVAHWSQNVSVNDWLTIHLPIAIPINPITKSNWEGEGVIPDINIDSNLSFETAYGHAKAVLQ